MSRTCREGIPGRVFKGADSMEKPFQSSVLVLPQFSSMEQGCSWMKAQQPWGWKPRGGGRRQEEFRCPVTSLSHDNSPSLSNSGHLVIEENKSLTCLSNCASTRLMAKCRLTERQLSEVSIHREVISRLNIHSGDVLQKEALLGH